MSDSSLCRSEGSRMCRAMARLSSFLKRHSYHSGFSGKERIELFSMDVSGWDPYLQSSWQCRIFISSFCFYSSAFIYNWIDFHSYCYLYCQYQNYSYSALSLLRCYSEKRMVSSFALFFSFSYSSCSPRDSISFMSSPSLSLMTTTFSLNSFSSFSISAMLALPAYNSSIFECALASCSSFLRSISLPLASFNSYSSLAFPSLASTPSIFAIFFFISAATLLELDRWLLSLPFFSFSSLTSPIKCSFVSISFPNCSERIFISDCCRSIFLSRQVTASFILICSSSADLREEEGGSAMISLSTCLTRLLLEDRLVQFITIILYKVYNGSSLWKSQLALPVLRQAVLQFHLLLAHLLPLARTAHQLRHLQAALQHVEDLALREDHQEGGQRLKQVGIGTLEDLQAQGCNRKEVPRKPGDQSRLASLQKPIIAFWLISNSCAKVSSTSQARRYCRASRQREVRAAGLHLNAWKRIIKVSRYSGSALSCNFLLILSMCFSLTMSMLRQCTISKVKRLSLMVLTIWLQMERQNLSPSWITLNLRRICSGRYSMSLGLWCSNESSIFSISSQKYYSLTVVFQMMEFTFFTLASQSFYTNFQMISLNSGRILSLQFQSRNFIHLRADSEVEVLFFSASISLSRGITLLKFTRSYRLISVMFCISMSLAEMLARLTSSSSWDINKSIDSKISSNRSSIIFLKSSFCPLLFLPSICTLKKEKRVLSQPSALKLVQLGYFPLAMPTSVPTILLMISSLRYCSSLPSSNFSFMSFSKLLRHSSADALKFFSLSPSMNRRSSRRSGRQMSRSMLMISLRLTIHLIRNSRTPGFLNFNFVFTISMKPSRSNSCRPSGELRAEVRMVCRDLSKKLAALRTTSSRSLILPISFSKIWLNILMILSSRVLAMQYRDLRAVILILCSLSPRQSRVALTMGWANLAMPSGQFLSPLTSEGMVSRPAILRLMSQDLRYLSLKKATILSI